MKTTTKLFGTLGVFGLFALAPGCLIVTDDGQGSSLGGTSNAGGRTTTGGNDSQAGSSSGGADNGGESASGGADNGGESASGGDGGTDFSFTHVTITGSARSGEIALSGQLGIAEGRLAMVLSSIKDPEDPTRPIDPATVAFQVAIDGEPVECDIAPTGETVRAAVDLVFINDTTGSMDGTVNGIADSIRDFANDVTARGVDARFAMVTYGDEFSTMTDGETAFTEGQAEYVSSAVDGQSRPYVDFSSLSTFETFLQEVQASDDLGQGGEDSPENTLGAMKYAIDHLDWRASAAHVFVVIGDDAAHTVDTVGSDWASQYLPPAVDDLLASLDGTAVAHVVGTDTGSDPYYNIKGLSDATGGAFITLPGDGVVDLSAMSLNNWVSSTFFGVCFGIEPTAADRTMEIEATVTGATEHTGAVTYDITLEW